MKATCKLWSSTLKKQKQHLHLHIINRVHAALRVLMEEMSCLWRNAHVQMHDL